jgi:hypothetical protein
MPAQNPYEAPKPDSQRAFTTVSPVAKDVAETLNWLTGGDEVQSGAVDVSPESLELWYDFLTGGVGRDLRRVSNLVRQPWRDEPVEVNEIPFVRRLFGEADPHYDQGEFYDNLRDLELVERRVKLYRERRDMEGLRAFMAANRPAIALAAQAERVRSRVKKQRDAGNETTAEATMRRFNSRFAEAVQ